MNKACCIEINYSGLGVPPSQAAPRNQYIVQLACRLLATVGVGAVLQGARGLKLTMEEGCLDFFVSIMGNVVVAFDRGRNVYNPSCSDSADSCHDALSYKISADREEKLPSFCGQGQSIWSVLTD